MNSTLLVDDEAVICAELARTLEGFALKPRWLILLSRAYHALQRHDSTSSWLFEDLLICVKSTLEEFLNPFHVEFC
jgi:hypothetical protein